MAATQINRKTKVLLILAAASVIGIVVFILLCPSRQYTPVSLKIELDYKDPAAWLGKHVSVDANGIIYTCEQVNGKYFYHAYSPSGNTIWRIEDRKSTGSDQTIVSFPGTGDNRLNWYVGKQFGWKVDSVLWVSVDRHGVLLPRRVSLRPPAAVEFLDAMLVPSGLYAVGTSEDAEAVAARFDTAGTRRWMRFEKSPPTEYGRAAVDGKGNLIACYDPDGIGIFIAKYSREGRLMWLKKEVGVRNGASTIWLGTDKNDRILALVRLHHTIWLTLNEAALFSKRGSRFVSGESDGAVDESGRDQDYVLMIFDSNGRLLRKKVLSHGARLMVEDVAMDSKGRLYLIGNRKRVNSHGFPTESDNAELIKCDLRGNIVCRGTVKLPDRCFAKGIALDSRCGIYVSGDTGGYKCSKTSLQSHIFIYKIEDHAL